MKSGSLLGECLDVIVRDEIFKCGHVEARAYEGKVWACGRACIR